MKYIYKCIKIGKSEHETKEIINEYAEQGWRLVCSYYHGYYLILEKPQEEN